MKVISLSQGYETLVDDEDYNYLNQRKWSIIKGKYGNIYVRTNIKKDNGKYTQISMHTLLLEVKKGNCIDHIDGNGLNNQKSNLREATYSQNIANRKKKKGNSKYLGVCFTKTKGAVKKWITHIRKNGKLIYLGCYLTEIEAAKAYDNKAKELFGEFANPNFK